MMFYFIKYRWKRIHPTSDRWEHANQVIAEHPLQWLHTSRTKYGKEKLGPNEYTVIYVLDFYNEITPKLFEKYKDLID